MKKISVCLTALFAVVSHATSVNVTNNSGQQNVWGAIYYVFSGSAQRAGSPQQISSQAILTVPEEEKPNAARYLIISRSPGLLESMIVNPFGTVGLRLFRLEKGQSIEIGRGKLPVERV